MVKFSNTLEEWLKSKGEKTVGDLDKIFREKSFAITILLLMFLPALPLPTGGITHIFEIITMLLALEMVFGRTTIWLPQRWRKMKLNAKTINSALPFIGRRIRWVEKYSRPRSKQIMNQALWLRFSGLCLLILALGAFLAPPFSGFDTLPALGAVAVALSLILDDIIVFIVGLIIGAAGIATILILGTAITETTLHLLGI